MQDYARLFPRSYLTKPRDKVSIIRRILSSKASPSLMLAAIALVVRVYVRK